MAHPISPQDPASTVAFGHATPILRVADLAASLAWYRDQLGFVVKWQTPVFAGVARGEMQVSDPDGHVLRFGSDHVPGEPMGDWLDGDGRRWRLQPDGSWRADV